MNGVATWVINLDRAPDRLARVSARLRALALPFTRLAAVDARQLLPEQLATLDTAGYERRHGKTAVLGELGCYLSHVAVLQAFLATEAQAALVLEDDVLLHDGLPAVLAALMQHPAHWDMVKLSGVHSGTPVRVQPLAAGHALAVMLSRCTGSSAYLVNRHAAQAYLRQPGGLLPMQLPYDHVFDQGWRFGLQVRLVTPRPCGHDEDIPTTITAPPSARRKFHWTRRLPAFAWRLRNESRRLAYALGQIARERLR